MAPESWWTNWLRLHRNAGFDLVNGRSMAMFRVMGWVYIIVDGDLAKVGFSVDPLRRLKELQMASAGILSLRYVVRDVEKKLERAAHFALRAEWHHGEWYDAAAAVKWARQQDECLSVGSKIRRVRLGRKGELTKRQKLAGFGHEY